MDVYGDEKTYNVLKTIINHPPVVTIFIGVMVTIPSRLGGL